MLLKSRKNVGSLLFIPTVWGGILYFFVGMKTRLTRITMCFKLCVKKKKRGERGNWRASSCFRVVCRIERELSSTLISSPTALTANNWKGGKRHTQTLISGQFWISAPLRGLGCLFFRWKTDPRPALEGSLNWQSKTAECCRYVATSCVFLSSDVKRKNS